jgi:transposase InsO family protein
MNQLYLICNVSKQAHHQALYRMERTAAKQELYIRLMDQARQIHPGMGLRTMYDLLQPEGIGRDSFVALGLSEGFRLKASENKTRTTFSVKCHRYPNLLGGLKFTDVNQIWSSDITYVYCLERFFYLSLILDVYSRRIVGYHLSDNMKAEGSVEALKMALTLRGKNHYHNTLIHHSDKGSQYASDLYTQTLAAFGIRISMCDEVYENTHIERVNDTIKNQYLNRMEVRNEQDLHRKTAQVVHTYNNLRPHQSIDHMPPSIYEALLQDIPSDKRRKLEIYTSTKNINYIDPNQLKLNFN